MPNKSKATERKTSTVPKQEQYLSNESSNALIGRLSRVEGHVRSVRRMIEQRRCADEVLLQIGAIKAAISKIAIIVADHEMKACMDCCMDGDANERVARTLKVISSLLKQ